MVSWNVLDCLCPAVLSFLEMLHWLKFSVRTRAANTRLLLTVHRAPHLLALPGQMVYSRDPLQCHL